MLWKDGPYLKAAAQDGQIRGEGSEAHVAALFELGDIGLGDV